MTSFNQTECFISVYSCHASDATLKFVYDIVYWKDELKEAVVGVAASCANDYLTMSSLHVTYKIKEILWNYNN